MNMYESAQSERQRDEAVTRENERREYLSEEVAPSIALIRDMLAGRKIPVWDRDQFMNGFPRVSGELHLNEDTGYFQYDAASFQQRFSDERVMTEVNKTIGYNRVNHWFKVNERPRIFSLPVMKYFGIKDSHLILDDEKTGYILDSRKQKILDRFKGQYAILVDKYVEAEKKYPEIFNDVRGILRLSAENIDKAVALEANGRREGDGRRYLKQFRD